MKNQATSVPVLIEIQNKINHLSGLKIRGSAVCFRHWASGFQRLTPSAKIALRPLREFCVTLALRSKRPLGDSRISAQAQFPVKILSSPRNRRLRAVRATYYTRPKDSGANSRNVQRASVRMSIHAMNDNHPPGKDAPRFVAWRVDPP